ncbi:heparan-alpha-glucosaminide N-acetyltransferase domain-containing protein [Capnocytophaga canimorsus]|uniref:heparan-alpha-glucosaminide N-acetyltransferase domain-containing protein n=1 Tax=Capnocytophaga canimorsus TaxID=28188 RepID=UPI0037D750F7
MKENTFRLYFIDIIRAFAICMMLQGHFVGSLMGEAFYDDSNILFSIWRYCTGFTAPVFFAVSGFIFMFLMIKESDTKAVGWHNPRVKKGFHRALLLIGIGYLLRLSFEYVDILHCIGISLLLLIGLYLFTYNKKTYVLPTLLILITLSLFTFEPLYKSFEFDFLPLPLANYLTRANGTIFSIFPWFGYVSFGASLGYFFYKYRNTTNLYRNTIILLTVGIAILWFKSDIFKYIYLTTDSNLFKELFHSEFLFLRLKNVLLVFLFFIVTRNLITSKILRKIGQNTLSIYVIHCILLYGSITGIGLIRFFKYSLNPYVTVIGALLFILLNVWLSFRYNALKPIISALFSEAKTEVIRFFQTVFYFLKGWILKVYQWIFSFIKH